jgi:RNA polymerase sigma-70 factor (ECF subfamily)
VKNNWDNEQTLISAIKDGDTEVFGELVKLYAERVYNFCYHLSGNDVDAKDLSQDVFIKALQSIHKFQQKSSLSTWLHQIAINLWIDKTRKRQKITFVSIDKPLDSEQGETLKKQLVESGIIPGKNIENKELEKVIQDALNKLSPEQKVVIVLKYIENKSLEEIAKICHCSVTAVGCRLFRGLKELRSHLKSYM